MNILLIDDHAIFREGTRRILQEEFPTAGFNESSDAEEAIEKGTHNDYDIVICDLTMRGRSGLDVVKQLGPDIILLDINMPGMNGIEAIPQLRACCPKSRIIGLSAHAWPSYARKMLREGAKGYLTKNSSTTEFFLAIDEVSQGRKYVCAEVRDLIADQFTESAEMGQEFRLITPRELDVIRLIKEGRSSKEIAQVLSVSLRTVEVHRYNILKKLNIKNSAALIDYLHRNNIPL